MENQFVVEVRAKKARLLAWVFGALHCSPETVEGLTAPEWADFAAVAQVAPPSQETKDLVLSYLREREDIERRIAALGEVAAGVGS